MTALPTLKLRVLPTFPSAVLGSGPITVTKANGVYTIGFNSSAVTWTGNYIFAPVSGDAITINPASNSFGRGFVINQSGPASGSIAGEQDFNSITASVQSTLTQTGTSPFRTDVAAGLKATVNTGGANVSGYIIGSLFRINHTLGNTNSAAGDYIALASQAYSNKVESGAPGLYGFSSIAYVDATGGVKNQAGNNSELTLISGGAVNYRVAYRAQSTISTAQAAISDAAFTVVSQGGGDLGFKRMINLSEFGNAQSISSTGDLLAAQQAMTIANVLNLSNVTVTNFILNSANAQLTGAGHLGLGAAANVNMLTMSLNSATTNGTGLTNTNSGGVSSWIAQNDVSSISDFGIRGSARASYGALLANEGYAYSNTNLVLMADTAAGVIKFTTGGNAEKGRFDASGNLLVGIASAPSLGDTTTGVRLSIQGTGGLGTSFGYIQMMNSALGNGNEMGRFTWGSPTFSGADKRTAVLRSMHLSASTVNPTGDIEFFTNNAGTLTEAMRVQPSGGLSIGLTNDSGVGTVNLKNQAFAALAAASATTKGALAVVTDSTTIVWGATITGGGANVVLAFCDGTNWTVAGK